MSTKDRHLSPAEAAQRLGVSVKALHLYESHGLVLPLRSSGNWRTYGPHQMARLHQVLALKRIGLPLARISEILGTGQTSLATVLELQEKVLSGERGRVERALSLVRAALARLRDGESLSIDDLATLTKETTMNTKATPEEMKAIFDPLSEKHFSKAERKELQQRSFDQAEASRGWDALMAEAKTLMEKGDPFSAAAQDLARRWMAQVRLFTQGDPAVNQKVMGMWKDAMANPDTAPKLPLGPEVFAFVQKAWDKAKEK